MTALAVEVRPIAPAMDTVIALYNRGGSVPQNVARLR